MDIHRNNAFSSENFDFVASYCERHIPKIKTCASDATYLMWLDCREPGLSNRELHDFMIQKGPAGPERRLRLREEPQRLYAAQRRLPPERPGAGPPSAGGRRQQPVRSLPRPPGFGRGTEIIQKAAARGLPVPLQIQPRNPLPCKRARPPPIPPAS